jgi:hypothetical protein
LVGFISNGSIENCYATGNVSGFANVGGLVGKTDDGSITNSAALNEKIVRSTGSNNSFGRITGTTFASVTLTGNVGLANMLFRTSADAAFTPANVGNERQHGADVSEALYAATGFPWNVNAAPWTYAAGKLPGLFGNTVDMPSYITQPASAFSIAPTSRLFTAGNTYNNAALQQVFTITNIGTNPIASLSASINNTNFEIVGSTTITNLAPNASANITVRPANGLSADAFHSGTLTVTDGGSLTRTAELRIYVGFGAAGSGTSGSPFVITTPEELVAMATLVNSGTEPFDRAHYILGNTIDLGGIANHTPIGTEANPFSGTFDGDGNTITGLTITGGGNRSGLFGYIEAGTVKNLGLIDVNISGGNDTGGIVGYLFMDSQITNCYVTGTISGGRYVGGIAGSNAVRTSLTGCWTTAAVSGTQDVGGIIGIHNLGTVSNNTALNPSITKTGGGNTDFGAHRYPNISVSSPAAQSPSPSPYGMWRRKTLRQ